MSVTLADLADSGPFHGLLLTVWGPRLISMINEPWTAFSCRSLTLVVFADSGPFLGLLLTDLGSLSDFHDCRTPGCVYVSFINNSRFVQF